MPNRIAFTEARVAALVPPADGRVYVHDAKTPSLCVCLSAAGGRVFYRVGRIDGRPVRLKLGRFPDIGVDTARKLCAQAAGQIAGGADPQATRRATRGAPTLSDLFDRWLSVYAKPHKRTWRDDVRQWNVYFGPLHGRRLATIRRADVQAWHARLGRERGPYQANRCLALLAALYAFAAREGHDGLANPARGILRFPEPSRERYIVPDEMGRFLTALRAIQDERLRTLFLVALLTGGRRRNVCAMRWADLDLDRGLWTIPADEFKSKRAVVIPLVRAAIDALRERRAAVPADCPWAFPSVRTTGHVVLPRKVWQALRTTAGLPDVRFHDIRRTLGSWAAAAGVSGLLIGKALGHAPNSKATSVYTRLAEPEPVREALDTAVQRMLAAGEPAKRGRKGATRGKA